MTRDLTAAMISSLQADTAELCWLIKLEFSGGTVYLTTATQDISWDSQSWQAVGGALEVGEVQETLDRQDNTLNLKLSGVDQSIVQAALGQLYRGRKATVWVAHLNTTTGAVIADPMLAFSGYMNDGFEIRGVRDESSGGTCEISTNLATDFSRLAWVAGLQCNPESHGRLYSGDLGFEYVSTLTDRVISWGQTKTVFRWVEKLIAERDKAFGAWIR